MIKARSFSAVFIIFLHHFIFLKDINSEERDRKNAASYEILNYKQDKLEFSIFNSKNKRDGANSYIFKLRSPNALKSTHFLLDEPSRFVVDIPDLILKKGTQLNPILNPLVRNVRVGVHSKMVRLVFDLASEALPEVQKHLSNEDVQFTFELNGKGIADKQIAGNNTIEGVKIDNSKTDHKYVQNKKQDLVTTSEIELPQTGALVSARRIILQPPPNAKNEQLPLAIASEPLQIDIKHANALTPEIPNERLSPSTTRQAAQYDFGTLPISIDKVWINFIEGERPIQDIRIKNRGESSIELITLIQKISEPGKNNESLQLSDELTISPKLVKLKAGEERTLRLLLKDKPVEREVNYRIVFSGNSELKDYAQASQDSIPKAAVAISVAALPSQAEPGIDWKVDGSKLVLENRGNVSIFLDSGVSCGSVGLPCDPLPSRRLYPGNSWAIEVAGKRQVEFVQRLKEENQQLIIPLTVTVTLPSAA